MQCSLCKSFKVLQWVLHPPSNPTESLVVHTACLDCLPFIPAQCTVCAATGLNVAETRLYVHEHPVQGVVLEQIKPSQINENSVITCRAYEANDVLYAIGSVKMETEVPIDCRVALAAEIQAYLGSRHVQGPVIAALQNVASRMQIPFPHSPAPSALLHVPSASHGSGASSVGSSPSPPPHAIPKWATDLENWVVEAMMSNNATVSRTIADYERRMAENVRQERSREVEVRTSNIGLIELGRQNAQLIVVEELLAMKIGAKQRIENLHDQDRVAALARLTAYDTAKAAMESEHADEGDE